MILRSKWMILGILVFIPALASAQESGPQILLESVEGVEDPSTFGFHPRLLLNGTFALGQSSNVPGSTDGLSMSMGYMILGGLDYRSYSQQHEWTQLLQLELGFTRTPTMDVYIKSMDRIDYRTSYLYHLKRVSWLGPFASLRMTTAMLRTADIRSEDTSVLRLRFGEEYGADGDGNPTLEGVLVDASHPRVRVVEAMEKIKLTPPFSPFTLRESVGMFAIPVDRIPLKLDIRLGAGAWQTFVNGGHALADDAATPDILELRAMEDTVQVGAELGVIATGAVGHPIRWGASALLMQPMVHNSDTTKTGASLLNMEYEAFVGVSLMEFLSIHYGLKAYRQPLIVDGWQVQNNLLISVGISLPRPAPEPQEPPFDASECPVCAQYMPEPVPVSMDEPDKMDEPGEAIDGDVQEADEAHAVAGSEERPQEIDTRDDTEIQSD